MPALQAPEDSANTGAVPATANAASASASEPYLFALKSVFMSRFLLTINTQNFRAKRSAAACCATHQHFEEERRLLRQVRHDCASGLLQSVSQPRSARAAHEDAASEYGVHQDYNYDRERMDG
jgi:hypothetical protein